MSDNSQRRSKRIKWGRYVILLIVLSGVTCGIFSFYGKAVDKPVNSETESTASATSAVSAVSAAAAKTAEESSDTDSDTDQILRVPFLNQKTQLPTGCELTSAMMLLEYYGINTSVDEIVYRTPESSLLSENSITYGMSPNQAFIGDPQSTDGLGCYAPVLTAVIGSYFWDSEDKQVVNATGTDLDKLVTDYIEKGSPVIIWATAGMAEPSAGQSWILADTNQIFQWISGEHCMVLVGSDQNNYYFNDPDYPDSVQSYNKALVQKRYSALGNQAVVVVSS